MSITGEEDGKPCKPGATIGDTGTGMLMAISILGAYVRCLRTGQGEHLQVGNAGLGACTTSATPSPTWIAPTARRRRVSAREPSGGGQPPIGVYPCKGGGPNDYVYIYTGAANPEHWTACSRSMGREDLIGDTRYSTAAARWSGAPRSTRWWPTGRVSIDKHTVMRLVGSDRPGRSACSIHARSPTI